MRPLSDMLTYNEMGEDGEPVTVTLTVAEAIARQRAAAAVSPAARRGFQYSSDEEALDDFIVIHWAWWV